MGSIVRAREAYLAAESLLKWYCFSNVIITLTTSIVMTVGLASKLNDGDEQASVLKLGK